MNRWYLFTTPDELDNLIALLNNEPENSKLVSGLKRKYEKIFGQKCQLDLTSIKKETKSKMDIGKMLTGETDAKVKQEAEESKNLNLRSLQFSKDDAENEKQAKYLSIDEIEEQLATEKQPSQFQTPIEKLLEVSALEELESLSSIFNESTFLSRESCTTSKELL